MIYYYAYIFLCIAYYTTSIAIRIPNPDNLSRIRSIDESSTIHIVERHISLQDTEPYGDMPHIEEKYFSSLNKNIEWCDPLSYKIKSTKQLYVGLLRNTFVSPRYLGTMFNDKEHLLFDIEVCPGYPLFWPVKSDIQRCAVVHHKKLATVQGPTYFYHWVIDRLPTVLLMKKLLAQDPEINC